MSLQQASAAKVGSGVWSNIGFFSSGREEPATREKRDRLAAAAIYSAAIGEDCASASASAFRLAAIRMGRKPARTPDPPLRDQDGLDFLGCS